MEITFFILMHLKKKTNDKLLMKYNFNKPVFDKKRIVLGKEIPD